MAKSQKAVYRVQTVVNYPDGHPVREQSKARGFNGPEHNVTHWEIVVAPGCEEAFRAVREKHESNGAIVKRIYSCNHLGDVTVEA